MHDELLFDKIEAYLKGHLPPSETAAFEAEIAADPELAMLVKTHRFERLGLEWLVERDLLTKMNAWERENSSVSNPGEASAADLGGVDKSNGLRVSFVRRWWAAGVAAALILGVFGWWFLQPQADIGGPPAVVSVPKSKPPASVTPKPKPRPAQKPPESQQEDAGEGGRVTASPAPSTRPNTPAPTVKPPAPAPATVDYGALAATYYRKDDFLKETHNGTAGGDSPGYGQALDSYKSGKYTDVEKLLKPALKNLPNGLKAKELLAHSLYQRGQYGEALNWFRQLAGSGDKALAERSEWAAALTLLHQMPAQKAQLERALDKIIAKPGHTFYAKAKELRGRIR